MQDTECTFKAGDDLIRPAAMRAEMGGIAEATLYEWVHCGLIPPPVRISARVTGWPRSVVDQIKRDRARGVLPKVDREAVPRAATSRSGRASGRGCVSGAKTPERIRKFYERLLQPWEYPEWHPLYVCQIDCIVYESEAAEFEEARKRGEREARNKKPAKSGSTG